MQFSFVKQLIDGVWMINPITASAYLPLLRGTLSGMEFEKEPEAENSRQYFMSTSGKENSSNKSSQIAITPLRGIILKHDGECGEIGTRTLASRLKKADAIEDVIGHIIICESGGGLASAVIELAEAIEEVTKPIVAWVDGMACSAAMYIISYCDKIIASRESDQVGCIGTMIQFQDYPQRANLQDGSIALRIYADGSEQKNEEFEEALKGNVNLIKERVLNPHNEQFKLDMKNNRPNVTDEHLKGRTYLAKDVVGILVDSIGSLEDAVNAVIEISNERNSQPTNKNMSEKITTLNPEQVPIQNTVAPITPKTPSAQSTVEENNDITLQSQINAQARAIASQTQTIKERDERIAELESALDAATADGAANDPVSAPKSSDGGSSAEDENVDEFTAARKFCQFIKSII